MLEGLQATNADTVILHQRLDIVGDDIAEFHIHASALLKCLEILHTTDQTYVVYICQVETPEID
jgi:hypothetical protein